MQSMVQNVGFFKIFLFVFLTSLAFSNNLIEVLVCWVGVNISLYALFVKGGVRSVEAGLKYFLVGLLVTCLVFFAAILFFFEYLSLDFAVFNFINFYDPSSGEGVVGLSYLQRLVVLLLVSAFLFKLGAFPFHFYLADVYHSAG